MTRGRELDALELGQLLAEVRVTRLPGRPQWWQTRDRRAWRWDVTWQQPIEGRHGGVLDARLHQDRDFGYTRTRWGAWRAVRRAYSRPPTPLKGGWPS